MFVSQYSLILQGHGEQPAASTILRDILDEEGPPSEVIIIPNNNHYNCITREKLSKTILFSPN